MSASPWLEPPVDTDEICARLRFSFDEHVPIPPPHRKELAEVQRMQRRRFRAQGLEASARSMPDIHAMVLRVCERLKVAMEPIVVIRSDPEPNAYALLGDERPMVVLQSGLVSLLSMDELSSVVAHEFGHAYMQHDRFMPDPGAASVFALARFRAQEVTADRVGLFGADSVEAALRAEIRVACGLDDRHLRIDLDAMVADAYRLMIDCENSEGEFHDTHPEYPFRLWAQSRFARSEVFEGLRGVAGGDPSADVEREIESHFLALAEGASFRAVSDLLHEALAWIGILIVAEDASIDESERDVLVHLVGTIWADDAAAFARRHGLESVKRRAKQSLGPLRHASSRDRQRIKDAISEFERRTGARARCDEMRALVAEVFE